MRFPFFHKRDPLLKDDTLLDEHADQDALALQETPQGIAQMPSPSGQMMPQALPGALPGSMPSMPAPQDTSVQQILKEFELINAKLNYLKSVLDQVNERLKRLEDRRW